MKPEELFEAQENLMDRAREVGMRFVGFFRDLRELGPEFKAYESELNSEVADYEAKQQWLRDQAQNGSTNIGITE